MTPKEQRAKLFKGAKPFIRKLEQDDLKWLYAAWKYPEPPGDDYDKFEETVLPNLLEYKEAFIAEDLNIKFKEGWGVVGVIPTLIDIDQWEYIPHVHWFPWATNKNKLRVSVAFVMFARYSNDIGVCIYKSFDKTRKFFDKLKKYAPIYKIKDRIPNGSPVGDVYLYYTRGRKRCQS